MAKSTEKALTYPMVIENLLRTVSGPLPVTELADQMQAVLPSSAREPRKVMVERIVQAIGQHLVFLDDDIILPLRLAYQGARFRLHLDRTDFDKGLLGLDPILKSYLPPDYPVQGLQFVDASGAPIPVPIQVFKRTLQGLFGQYEETRFQASLGDWYRTNKITPRDQLLVTIRDWENGLLQLERLPAGRWSADELGWRDKLLANMFYDLLEGAHREEIYTRIAIPTVYARLTDKSGCPPAHWMDILAGDERMDFNEWCITYSDYRLSPMENMMGIQRRVGAPVPPVPTPEQRRRIHTFRAQLGDRPGIWREIEIEGRQTLADLDRALRMAFNHDVFDHMGGFWKLIPRAPRSTRAMTPGRQRPGRVREVDLGSIDPSGGGDGAGETIAELRLELGGELKYVYDFGDWIEYRLSLRAVEAPQPGLEYPREVARNKPRHAFCVECRKTGKKEIALWVCPECSNAWETPILLCQACAREHPDHYLEAILY